MAQSALRLRDLLSKGQPALATFMTLRGMRAAQVIAHTGLDAVIIDGEHGYVGDCDIHDMVTAVASAGISPIVRTRGPTLPLIKQALDTGAHGLLVPMVNTAQEAQSVVTLAKFPPRGLRGQGSPFSCFALGMSTSSEYVSKANDLVLTMIQVESVEGLKNIEEICQVNGVDLVFIGPNDLALALLGYTPAKYTEPVFLEAIDRIAKTAQKHGKKAGILVPNGEAAKKAKKRFDLVAISADARAIHAWYSKEVLVARS